MQVECLYKMSLKIVYNDRSYSITITYIYHYNKHYRFYKIVKIYVNKYSCIH